MIGAVHVTVGAALGSILRDKTSAFAAGVASHVVTDSLPHRDYRAQVEAPLLAATLAGIAAWKGPDSPEFWGGVGAIVPDIEHVLNLIGLIDEDEKVFPTHINNGKYHGRKARCRWPQLLVTLGSVLIIALRR
ncbi:MAG: hypothetical protein N3B12_01480 [Armatimonadetes bacterium]|nr:hypothetical protein [Armatimonadota bacterium]